jgi:hypothetical protein
MARKRKPALFNYARPQDAGRTLKALRAAYPDIAFEVALSPHAAYAFRYVIKAHRNGHAVAYVKRTPLGQFGTLLHTVS